MAPFSKVQKIKDTTTFYNGKPINSYNELKTIISKDIVTSVPIKIGLVYMSVGNIGAYLLSGKEITVLKLSTENSHIYEQLQTIILDKIDITVYYKDLYNNIDSTKLAPFTELGY